MKNIYLVTIKDPDGTQKEYACNIVIMNPIGIFMVLVDGTSIQINTTGMVIDVSVHV